MNLAIILGISKYDGQRALPPCDLDADRMAGLIDLAAKYDQKLILKGHQIASEAKSKIRDFLGSFRGQPIDEIFFYFSGHGSCPDDLYLCCSDFDPARPNSTALENEELDELFRGLTPTQMVKIIDACNSGIQYVKGEVSAIEKALRKSGFKAFVCMASSEANQESYAEADGSDFTREFISAIRTAKEGQRILYRDIKAAISDSFKDSPLQTPIFIFQGNGQECFAVATPELVAGLSSSATLKLSGQAPKAQRDIEAIVEKRITDRAAAYVSEDELKTAMATAKGHIEKYSIRDTLVSRFYSSVANLSPSLESLPKSLEIAEFASRNKWPANYFVDVVMESYAERVLKSIMARAALGVLEPGDEDYVTRTKTRPGRIKSRHALPWEVLDMKFEPKKPGLCPHGLLVGVIHSRTHAILLSTTVRYKEGRWDRWEIDEANTQWKTETVPLKDVLGNPELLYSNNVDRSVQEVRDYILKISESSEGKPDSTTK